MPPADGYAGLWITMNLWRRDTASRFRVRAAVKELSGMLKQLGIDAPQASSLEQELVYRELVHAVRLYLPPAQRQLQHALFGHGAPEAGTACG